MNIQNFRGQRQASPAPAQFRAGAGPFRAGQFPGNGTYVGEPSGTGLIWNGVTWVAATQTSVMNRVGPYNVDPSCAPCAAEEPWNLDKCAGCCFVAWAGDKQAVVLAAGTATLTITPQESFLPFLLTIPSTIAAFFDVVSIMIGNNNVILDGPIGADTWSEVATYHIINPGCISGTSQSIVITATNISPDTHYFSAAFAGYYNP